MRHSKNTIAYQCPLQGGNSVYQARSYLAQYDNDPIYTDQLNCFNVGIYRKGKAFEVTDIFVYPNPTSDNFTLTTFSNELFILNYQIFDNLGVLVIQKNDVLKQKQFVNTEKLTDGLYIIKVKLNNGVCYTSKINIIH